MIEFRIAELLILLCSGGGGGNDLLDYLPTEAYWQQKGVAVTAERMVADLAMETPADVTSLIRDLGADEAGTRKAAMSKLRAIGASAGPALRKAAESDDPEVRDNAREVLKSLAGPNTPAVRRLMAIRSLGGLRKADSLPALRALLQSKEPFVAEYAAQAIASIEGKPPERPRPTDAMRRADLALLPAHCGVVGQAALPTGKPVAPEQIAQFLKVAEDMPAADDAHVPFTKVAPKMLTLAAERLGNVRIDTLTLGLSERIDGYFRHGSVWFERGFVVLIARGQYDADAARIWLADAGVAPKKLGGLDVFSPKAGVWLIPAANDLFVAALCPQDADDLLKELAAAVKKNGDPPAQDPKLAELIKSVDPSAPVWAAAIVTESYRGEPFLAPFESATLTSKAAPDGSMALTLVASGKDADAIGARARLFGLEMLRGQAMMKVEVADNGAFLKPFAEFLMSVRAKVDGPRVEVTATLKNPPAFILIPVIGLSQALRGAAPAAGAPVQTMPVDVFEEE